MSSGAAQAATRLDSACRDVFLRASFRRARSCEFYLGTRRLLFEVSARCCHVVGRSNIDRLIAEIEIEEKVVPWAAAGSNITLYLSGIERINIGYVLSIIPIPPAPHERLFGLPVSVAFSAQPQASSHSFPASKPRSSSLTSPFPSREFHMLDKAWKSNPPSSPLRCT